jgi:hypothetical protein
MKRFLVFCYDSYYPGGAEQDFVGDTDTLEDAQALGMSKKCDWTDILDTSNGSWS